MLIGQGVPRAGGALNQLDRDWASPAMSSDESGSEEGDSWISWFCGLQGHEMLCEVDRSYIEDSCE